MKRIYISTVLIALIAANCLGANIPKPSDIAKLAKNNSHTRKRANQIKADKTSALGTWHIYLVDSGKILAHVESRNIPIKKKRGKYDSPWIILTITGHVIEWDGKIIVTTLSRIVDKGAAK